MASGRGGSGDRSGGGGAGGRGRLGGTRPGAGPGGNCVCPNCGHKVPHQRGLPCYERACPKCSTRLVRE